MFKVNNKDTRMTLISLFLCLCCKLWTFFTPCSGVCVVNVEHVITSRRRTVVTRLVGRLKSTNSIQTNLTDTDDVMIVRSHDFTKTSWLYVKKGYFCQIQVVKDSVPLTYFTLRLTWKTFDNLIIRSRSIGEILL